MTTQDQWHWCNSCGTLAWNGDGRFDQVNCSCHSTEGSGDYVIDHTVNPGGTCQGDWKWCCRCLKLVYTGPGQEGNECAAGGPHDHTGSGEYFLFHTADPGQGPSQNEWKWCKKCSTLNYEPTAAGKACPAGDIHDFSGSGDYFIKHSQGAAENQQNRWEWCNKCGGLGYTQGDIPYHGAGCQQHRIAGSGNYILTHTQHPGGEAQGDWRWCNKCMRLVYTGGDAIGGDACAQGGDHEHDGSGEYFVSYNAPCPSHAGPSQNGWKWCKKCSTLNFEQTATGKACPGGNTHDFSGSGDYFLSY